MRHQARDEPTRRSARARPHRGTGGSARHRAKPESEGTASRTGRAASPRAETGTGGL